MNDPQTSQGKSSWSRSGEWLRERGFLRQVVERVATKYQAKFDESDIVQQTMLEAYAGIDGFQGETEKERILWLRRILYRNLLDSVKVWRCRKRSVARETPIADDQSDSQAAYSRQLAADQTSPSAQVANSEKLRMVEAAIGRLPAAQREAVTLHHLHGWTLAEVAAHMQKSRAAVAGLLHRGLSSVRSEIGEF